MSISDGESQEDEIAALTAIFGSESWIKDLTRPQNANPQYSIQINSDVELLTSKTHSVTLTVTFPPDYPSSSPPSYLIEGPWLKRSQRQKLTAELEDLYLDHVGENIVFLWIEKVKEILNEFTEKGDLGERSPIKTEERRWVDENVNDIAGGFGNDVADFDESILLEDSRVTSWELPEIYSGEPLTDRKSTFQAFLAHVVHEQQANLVLKKLLENKKIANATHNMWAFRICDKSQKDSPVVARCDDDGETHAGSRMLHLLEILDATNVMVVVSRWFGGIMLGPDRFKHISNVTRNILEENGFLKDKKESGKGKKKT